MDESWAKRLLKKVEEGEKPSDYDKNMLKALGIQLPDEWDTESSIAAQLLKKSFNAPSASDGVHPDETSGLDASGGRLPQGRPDMGVVARGLKAAARRMASDLPDVTISDIRKMNKKSGGFFFSRDTMKSAGSVVFKPVIKCGNTGWLFFTSEKDDYDPSRTYAVRMCLPDGDITTPKSGFKTAQEAQQWVQDNLERIIPWGVKEDASNVDQ